MQKILIDIDSIKENPNYGKTQTAIPGQWSGSCKINCRGQAELDLPLGCMVTSELIKPNGSAEYDILIGSIDAYHQLSIRTDDISDLQMSRDHIFFNHMPESKWLYNYENTPVQCSNCLQLIPVQKIEIEIIEAGAKNNIREMETTVCPLCDSHFTLQHEYETIDEALTRKNK